MSQGKQRHMRHRPRSLGRRIAGWLVVAAGLAMIVLPGPGILFLAFGILILGPHDPVLRRWAVIFRLELRKLSRADSPKVRLAGQWLRQRHHHARLMIREQLHRHACGQPFSPGIRIWIGLTLFGALASLGVGLFMILS
jgi:hypothetical protein